MQVIDKIRNFITPKKNKNKVLIKSKFGLPAVRVCGVVLADGGTATAGGSLQTGAAAGVAATLAAGGSNLAAGANNLANTTLPTFMPKTDQIEEIYVLNNEDAKDLIISLNGVITVGFGKANDQYDAIRIGYEISTLDLSALIKIYSFTSGNKIIFAKNSKQRNEYDNILKSKNFHVDIIDLVNFEGFYS